jgi:hypothetical protein
MKQVLFCTALLVVTSASAFAESRVCEIEKETRTLCSASYFGGTVSRDTYYVKAGNFLAKVIATDDEGYQQLVVNGQVIRGPNGMDAAQDEVSRLQKLGACEGLELTEKPVQDMGC